MIDPRHVDFLVRLGADRKSHSGRTLLEHLKGTAALLEGWGCAPEVCVAGLFHSIYGTNAFRFRTLPLDARAPLVQLIGPAAERLAHLFCTCDRPAAIVAAASSGCLPDRLDGAARPVDAGTVRQLLEIECANLIEQGGGRKTLRSIVELHSLGRIVLADAVIAAACAALGEPANV
jgi:hypothetical protein